MFPFCGRCSKASHRTGLGSTVPYGVQPWAGQSKPLLGWMLIFGNGIWELGPVSAQIYSDKFCQAIFHDTVQIGLVGPVCL